MGDRITRLRDKFFNRLPWFYAHSVPVVHDVPLKETALAGAIEEIRVELPVAAADPWRYKDRGHGNRGARLDPPAPTATTHL